MPAAAREPLDCAALLQRFPQLRTVMDPAVMDQHLAALLPGGWWITASERPRAELHGGSCSLQYRVTAREQNGATRSLTVLGEAFADADAARRHHAELIAPLARQAPPAPWRWSSVVPELRLALSVFPVVPAVPGLLGATDRRVMDERLSAIWRRPAAVRDVELVVLRRTRGCVLRYTLDEPRLLYGKAGYSLAPADLVAEAVSRLAAAAPAGAAVVYPEVAGRVEELGLSLVWAAPGRRADLRDRSQVDQLVRLAGAAAAVVHASGLELGPSRGLGDAVQRAADSVGLVHEYDHALAGRLRAALPEVTEAGGEAVFCHGDLTPSQLLVHRDAVSLLDFDKLCRGEPALDLGRFAAYLGFALTKHGLDDQAGAATGRFLAAYAAAGGRSVDPERIAAHRRASLVRMAARSWLQLKRRRLDAVLRTLDANAAFATPVL